MNEDLTECLIVLDYRGTSYSFPRGKIDEGEIDSECAIREIKEEIDFDISEYIDENEYLLVETHPKTKVKLFLIPGISTKTKFKCNTRKEISAIEWYSLSALAN